MTPENRQKTLKSLGSIAESLEKIASELILLREHLENILIAELQVKKKALQLLNRWDSHELPEIQSF